jgi:hypothetical protein
MPNHFALDVLLDPRRYPEPTRRSNLRYPLDHALIGYLGGYTRTTDDGSVVDRLHLTVTRHDQFDHVLTDVWIRSSPILLKASSSNRLQLHHHFHS